MKRQIDQLKNQKFDILIIGGGISGAAIAWDAALRGYRVALVEKKDFGHATSSATSKMIHGGLRYLAQYDFGVVRESLHERRLLEQNLPQQAFPLPFLLPVYRQTPTSRWLLKAGLSIYDLFSYDKNELSDPDKYLSNHHWLSKAEAMQQEPGLNPVDLKGAYVYYDVQNRHPHRSNLSYILSAAEKGACVANYVSMQSFLLHQENGARQVRGIVARDELNGENFEITATVTVNASGPWGDLLLRQLGQKPARELIRSKGIHLLFPRVQQHNALTFETADQHHFFVLPWLNYTLLGTTDTPFAGEDPDQLTITKSEIMQLLDLVNSYYPANLRYEDLLHAYAGIRPLIKATGASNYSASRKHEIVNHAQSDQIQGLVSVFGGKWTTSRALAQDTVDLLQKQYQLGQRPCLTAETPLHDGVFNGRFQTYLQTARHQDSDRFSADIIQHLVELYGNRYQQILALAEKNHPAILQQNFTLLEAEIVHAVQNEMAQTLEDLLLRRNGLGNTGMPAEPVLQAAAAKMATLLGWSSQQTSDQISAYRQSQSIVDDQPA